MGAGFAAENPEFVLQADDIELAGVQKRGGANILTDAVILDLQRDRSRIVIGLIVVGHRHDEGLQAWLRIRNRAVQVGGKCRDTAAARQRIADHRDPAERRQVRASVGPVNFGRSEAAGCWPSLCNSEPAGACAGYAIRAVYPLPPTSMLVSPLARIACPIDSGD